MNDREQFLADRRKGIGGSDVAALCGLDDRKTSYMVWREKLGLDADLARPAMRRGNFLERAILDRYCAVVQPARLAPRLPVVSGWRRANVDAVAWDVEEHPRVVEAKSVTRRVFRDDWGMPWTDEVPDRALCQGLWYADLVGALLIDFAVCVIPDDPDLVLGCTPAEVLAVSQFHVFRATRNADAELAMFARASTFWHGYVLTQQPPPCETADDVDLRWPATTKKKVAAGEPVLALLREYEKACEVDLAAGKLREKLREKILLYAEDAEALVGPDGKTPWLTCATGDRVAHTVPAGTQRTLRFTKWWRRLPVPETQPQKESDRVTRPEAERTS